MNPRPTSKSEKRKLCGFFYVYRAPFSVSAVYTVASEPENGPVAVEAPLEHPQLRQPE